MAKDDKQPYTDGYSVNVDQTDAVAGICLNLSYVGNRSRDGQNTQGGYGSNINLVPAGALFTASNPGNGQCQ